FGASIAPLYFLGIAGIVLVSQQPLGNILLGTGRHRLMAFIALGEALVNLVLSLILVRRYGMTGVAAGTALPVVAANVFIVLPAACRRVGLTIGGFLRLVAVAPVVGAVPAILVCVALRLALPLESIRAILLEGAVVGAVYGIAVCAFGFDYSVRARYVDQIRRLFDRPLVRLEPDATATPGVQ